MQSSTIHIIAGDFATLLRIKRSHLGLAEYKLIGIVNLKVDSANTAALTLGEEIFPGFHMNHCRRISVLLDSNVPDELIEGPITNSRVLTT
ncbi:MmcQ/YjbR family DNA-binding protein [uncultured Olegusella sp.]|uniref:MmcQ/YjbR family DNA-binding protein n=1 Tax=uncultured Olegusella sp. TaxID=1979846 RepID=UPI0026341BB5|nr:MmcQ/YjbR family DNA-binding protein [uncultured Olegusella sp.]